MTRTEPLRDPEVWKMCPVCRRPWRPWAGTKLQSHAKCAMTSTLQDDLLVVLDMFPALTQKRLADDLGVSLAVLRANLESAKKRRREAERAVQHEAT